jgi:tight adherence protein C
MSALFERPTLFLGATGVTVILLLTTAIYMLTNEVRARRLNMRIKRTLADAPTGGTASAGLISALQRLGEWSRRFYAPANVEHLRSVIQTSGFNPHRTLPILLGGKLTLAVVIPAVAFMSATLVGTFQIKLAIVGAGIILGLLGPELILGLVRKKFKATLERGTPDALDLLVVCSEAGMGLESALERVAQEMRTSSPPTANALTSLLDDLRVLPNRRDAFVNIGNRSGVEGLRRFGTMLSQSLQYGTPLSHALRAVADELRRDRMNRLEEKAVKLPGKLIFPLIGFIMPSLYIVLLGPSFLRLYDSLVKSALF